MVSLRKTRVIPSIFDKYGEEVFVGDMLRTPSETLLKVCISGNDGPFLLNSVMFPFDIKYAEKCMVFHGRAA